MDLAERVVQWWQRSGDKRRKNHFGDRSLLCVEESNDLRRLDVICQAIDTLPVRILLTSGLEISDPGTLFLPRILGICRLPEANFEIYLYRVLTYLWARRIGAGLREGERMGSKAHSESVSTIPSLNRALASQFSGFSDLLHRVQASVSESSEHYSRWDPAFLECSEILKKALGFEDFELDAQDKNKMIREWKNDWKVDPLCPLQALPVLPNLNQDTDKLPLPGELEVFGPTSLPKASKSSAEGNHVKTVSKPKVKTMKEGDENPLCHVFEKLLTADEHQGGTKNQDGSDEYEDHADALSELTLDSVVRSNASAETLLRSDAVIETVTPEVSDRGLGSQHRVYQYPEWFRDERRYREKFCTVYECEPEDALGSITNDEAPSRNHLSQKLSAFLNKSRWKTKQTDGPEFDLDSVVRWRSQIQGSGPTDSRLYLGRRSIERDLAILMLLDSSLSTDAWCQNRRVIDVMKSAIFQVGDALSILDDQFGIVAFNSYSRARCNFNWVKRFDEDWRKGRRRLQGVHPEGYTRIGPALRHSQALMNRMRARRKLILLLSDAKPSDYDRYEGVHGLDDVRKAVLEIKSHRIFVKGISVAQKNRGALVHMFGAGQYEVLSEPEQIANQVAQIFFDLMKVRDR